MMVVISIAYKPSSPLKEDISNIVGGLAVRKKQRSVHVIDSHLSYRWMRW